MNEEELMKTMRMLTGLSGEKGIEDIVVKWSGLTISEFVEEINSE